MEQELGATDLSTSPNPEEATSLETETSANDAEITKGTENKESETLDSEPHETTTAMPNSTSQEPTAP